MFLRAKMHVDQLRSTCHEFYIVVIACDLVTGVGDLELIPLVGGGQDQQHRQWLLVA